MDNEEIKIFFSKHAQARVERAKSDDLEEIKQDILSSKKIRKKNYKSHYIIYGKLANYVASCRVSKISKKPYWIIITITSLNRTNTREMRKICRSKWRDRLRNKYKFNQK